MLLKWFICAAIFNLFPVYVFSKNVSREKPSDDFVPCDNEWFHFGEKCYKLGGRKTSEKLSWDRAEARCNRFGGNLVSIQTAEEFDFITTFLLLDIKNSLWIGLNDRVNESNYSWSDGSALNFSNWGDSEPSGIKYESEDCVEMWFDKYLEGKGTWNDVGCDRKLAYICETDTNTQKSSPNPQYCSSEAGGGWKYQNSCYHIIEEMKTWQNAEQHCKDSFNGHLITVLDIAVDTYLDYILSKTNKDFWIGIKIRSQLQQKWTSGYFVSYNSIKKDRDGFIGGTCVVRKNKNLWMMLPCSDKNSFICEVSEDRPTILKSPVNGSCPESPVGWRDLGGEFCYFIETKKLLNWYEADFDCKRRGGNLLSIHSKEENDVLDTFVRYSQQIIFIGLFRLLADEDVFVWSDGSDLNYENWAPGEPQNEHEKCVVHYTPDKAWHDYPCAEKKGYICSVKKISPNTAVVGTIPCATPSYTSAVETTPSTVPPNTAVVETTPTTVIPDSTILGGIQYAVITNATVAETLQCAVIPNRTTIQCTAMPNTTVIETTQCTGHISVTALIVISVCILLVIILFGVAVCFFGRWKMERRKHSSTVYFSRPLPSTNQQIYRPEEFTIKYEDPGYEMMV